MRFPTIARAAGCTTLALAVACNDTTAPIPKSADHAVVFDALWREIDQRYPYFALNGVNWDSVRAVHRPRAIAAASDEALARELDATLRELEDPHVSITPFGPGSTMRYLADFDTTATHYSASRALARYLPASRASADGRIISGWAAPAVGYIRLPSFADKGWASDVDEPVAAFASASALIIDVRGNMGGYRSSALDIAGRFADRTREFGFLRYRSGAKHTDLTAFESERFGPHGAGGFSRRVFVLADRHTLSSAENFVMAMRTLPNVTVIGDTTGGASGGPVERKLPNGWAFQYSECIEYTTAGGVVERNGIAPDLVVRGQVGDELSGRDRALEVALQIASAPLQRAVASPAGPQ